MIDVSADIFFQLGIIIIAAAVAAFILKVLKQPQLLAYVLVGILITPVFGLVTNTKVIEAMSTLGIAFLLFLVGLEMDFKKLKSVAAVSTGGGLLQVVILFVIGFFISLLLGFTSLESTYFGLLISFSSTMVVMKLLSDQREINTLHGRIIIGILLLQDIVAIFALSVMTSINGFNLWLLAMALVKFISLFILAYVCSRFVFPKTFGFAAKHHELLFIMSLAVCFAFSSAFSYVGFSIAIGAFVAGLALANLSYNLDIVSKMKSLRDFFSMIFFVSLGMILTADVLLQRWTTVLLLLIVVLLIKPIIILVTCALFKFTKKPSFFTAISLAQVGEFSLILITQGLVLGHISSEMFSIVVFVTIVSITLTPYFIKYQNLFYKIFSKPLKIIDHFNPGGMEYTPTEIRPKVVLCGHNRIGYSILRELSALKKEILIVDYNPEIIAHLVKEGYHCVYGDVGDEEIREKMNLKQLELLISTVPDIQDNILLIKKIREVNKSTKIIVTASDIEDTLKLYAHGADYVILPHFLGGEHVAKLISNIKYGKVHLGDEKKKHLKHLKERRAMGHEHPLV